MAGAAAEDIQNDQPQFAVAKETLATSAAAAAMVAGVAFKERYNMPVVADLVEREQPAHLRDWFRERLIAHRLASVSLSRLPWEPKQK